MGWFIFFTRLWKLRKNTGVLSAAGENGSVYANIKPHSSSRYRWPPERAWATLRISA